MYIVNYLDCFPATHAKCIKPLPIVEQVHRQIQEPKHIASTATSLLERSLKLESNSCKSATKYFDCGKNIPLSKIIPPPPSFILLIVRCFSNVKDC